MRERYTSVMSSTVRWFLLLGGCVEQADEAGDSSQPVEAPEPYVRLDGVDYDSFGQALNDAVDGSLIEFCGTREGPFARTEALTSLSIQGCAREFAVLDGQHLDTVLTVPAEELYLSDLTLWRGMASRSVEIYPESESWECEDCGEYDAYHAAAVELVTDLLRLDRCAVTYSSAAEGGMFAISVDEGVTGVGPEWTGGRLEGEGTAAQHNFTEDQGTSFIWANYSDQTVDVAAWDWGDGDSQNGNDDLSGPAESGTWANLDLTGIASVKCNERKGCTVEQE